MAEMSRHNIKGSLCACKIFTMQTSVNHGEFPTNQSVSDDAGNEMVTQGYGAFVQYVV